jgi:2'-5' RNA ligase
VPRLFVAISVPPALRAELAKLERRMDGVKWVPEHQLHLTLRFIGDFEDVTAVKRELRAIAFAPFSLRITGAGQFPPKRAARVLWAGLTPVQEISALAKEVDRAVIAAGVAPEDRDFSPHLTLARIKDAPRTFAERFLEDHRALELDAFTVEAFTLYQSELSPKGAKHTALEAFKASR